VGGVCVIDFVAEEGVALFGMFDWSIANTMNVCPMLNYMYVTNSLF